VEERGLAAGRVKTRRDIRLHEGACPPGFQHAGPLVIRDVSDILRVTFMAASWFFLLMGNWIREPSPRTQAWSGNL
jgi:hypothetical protein